MTTFKECANKTLNWYKNHRLVVNLVSLFVVLFMCCFMHWASYLAGVLLIFAVLTEKNYGGIYYLLFSLPFLNVAVIGQYGYLIPIAAILYVIFNFIKAFIFDKGKINKIALFFIILLEIYLALPINPYSSMTFIKMGVFFLAFMFLEILREKGRFLNFKVIVYCFYFGLLASSLSALFAPYSEIIQGAAVDFDYKGYTRFCGLLSYPSFYSLFCTISICLLLYLVFNDKYKLFNLLLALIITVFGFMTMSKSFILLFIVVLFFAVIKMFTVNPKKALIIFGIMLVAFVLIYVCFTDYVTAILQRFSSSTHFDDIKEFNWSEILTFRNDIWGEYLVLIFQSPHAIFFGYGLGAGGINPHNTYIGTWYQAGLIGFVLIFFLLFYMVFQIYKMVGTRTKLDWFTAVPMLVIAMELFVEGFLFL